MTTITLDNELLLNAIGTVAKVTSGAPVAHFKLMHNKMLQVSAMNKGTGVALYLPCKADAGEGGFAIDPNTFQSAIQGRKEMSIEISGNTIKLSSQRYKAELVTVTAEKEKIIPKKIKEGADSIKLTNDMIEFIRSNLADIELHPVLKTYSFMPIAVKSTKKGTIMACYDNWHMAFIESDKIKGDMEFCLPASSLNLLIREFRGRSYKMHLTDATLYAYNDSFELALPLPQQDAQNVIEPAAAFEVARQIKEEKGLPVLLSTDDMASLAPNMESVYKQGEHVDFKVEKDNCKIILKSTHGKVVSTVRCKAKKEIAFRTGFGFLKDILTKMPKKKLAIKVVPEKMIFFSKGPKIFMLGLYSRDKQE